jgi:hypothetical protein
MAGIDANKITVTLAASVRLQAYRETLARYRYRLISNPLDEEAAFAVKHFETVIEMLREEVNNEWPEYVDG